MLVSHGVCVGEKTRTIRVINNSDLEDCEDESKFTLEKFVKDRIYYKSLFKSQKVNQNF